MFVPLRDIVFKALAVILDKHPVLSAIPMNEDSSNPYFIRLPSIDLEEAVTFIKRKEPYIPYVKDAELDQILESQHNRGFQERLGKLPFWRLLIITGSEGGSEFTAAFIFHHSLGDGTSGIVFHRDFLSALQNPSIVLSSKVLPRKEDLLPNLELLHPLPISVSQQRHVPTNLWSGEKVTIPTSSRFKSLYLCQPATRKFVKTCKEQSTTVTATIPVIVAAVLMNLIPIDFKELECTVPVSLRRWMPAPVTQDSFGVWIDAFSQYYRRENVVSFSWDEARRSRETINDYLKSDGESINVAKFKNINDMKQFFLSRVGTERGTSFDVSNLGGVRGKDIEEGSWKIGTSKLPLFPLHSRNRSPREFIEKLRESCEAYFSKKKEFQLISSPPRLPKLWRKAILTCQ
jgi:hypothetical protein